MTIAVCAARDRCTCSSCRSPPTGALAGSRAGCARASRSATAGSPRCSAENARMIITIEARARGRAAPGHRRARGGAPRRRAGELLPRQRAAPDRARARRRRRRRRGAPAAEAARRRAGGGMRRMADDGWRRASALARDPLARGAPRTARPRSSCTVSSTRSGSGCVRARRRAVPLQLLARTHPTACCRDSGGAEGRRQSSPNAARSRSPCEFCDAEYRYDPIDVEALFLGAIEPDEGVRH